MLVEVVERHVLGLVLGVDEDTVALAERPPSGVLPRGRRTGVPSSTNDPKAAASPSDQSIVPSSNARRCAMSSRASFGLTWNVSGHVVSAVTTRSSTERSTAVATGSASASSTVGPPGSGCSSWGSWVSSNARSRRPRKSATAASHSAAVRSPRWTSCSV